jgi:methylase of polypeptide subunit release factors
MSKWEESHKPFHWFCDFHSIMQSGGFDVIIGNPPYVEYRRSEVDYAIVDRS